MFNLIFCLVTLTGSWFFSGLFINGDDRAWVMFLAHGSLLFGWWNLRVWPLGLAAFNLATLVAMAALISVAWDEAPPRAYFKVLALGALAAFIAQGLLAWRRGRAARC